MDTTTDVQLQLENYYYQNDDLLRLLDDYLDQPPVLLEEDMNSSTFIDDILFDDESLANILQVDDDPIFSHIPADDELQLQQDYPTLYDHDSSSSFNQCLITTTPNPIDILHFSDQSHSPLLFPEQQIISYPPLPDFINIDFESWWNSNLSILADTCNEPSFPLDDYDTQHVNTVDDTVNTAHDANRSRTSASVNNVRMEESTAFASTDDRHGPNAMTRQLSKRSKLKPKSSGLELEEIQQYFHLPIVKAAKELRVGVTVLKKRCRELNIARWPHRKIKSLKFLIDNVKELGMTDENEIEMLEDHKKALEKVPGLSLTVRTKKLRQACFKANYKRRRLLNTSSSPL